AYCLKTQPATGETYPKSDLFNKANGMHNVCYANGFNPDTTDFDELWDRMRDACGGDDFCESLELDPRSIELLSRTKPCLKIMLSETELEVIAGGQK
ncbi:DUF3085 domain-containing protein, partial [Klebsiella pneumoniae]|uniref:DUF3085 domain-containing protein n=1 Tax=Klebsiella pneumoniae TaxID=573 RepID=UPI001F1F7D4A